MRKRVRETIIAMEEQKILKMISGCVAPFFIQQAKRMRRIIFLSVACFAVPYISKLSHKQDGILK